MGITLRKFLQDYRTKDLVLVAGSGGINCVITRVTVLDAPDGPSWLKGGEFILTSTFQFSNDSERLCSFCEQLINFRASGFGLKMGRYLTKVPQSLIDLCDRNNFPLLIIPYSLVWTDLISVFYELSYNLEREEKYSTLKSKLVGQIRIGASQGLNWVGEKIFSFFDTPILFLDQHWKSVVGFGSQAEQEGLRKSISEFMREGPDQHNIKLFDGKYYVCCQCLLKHFGAQYVLLSSDSNNILGELCDILTNAGVIKEEEKMTLDSEDDLINHALSVLVTEGQIAFRHLENLEQYIKQTGGYYCLLCIGACKTQQIVEELKNQIRHLQSGIKAFAIYNLGQKMALVLLRFLTVQKHYQATMELRQLMRHTSDYFCGDGAERIYISNIYDTYKKLEQSFRETRLTEQYSSCIWPSRRLCYFEEIFPYYLIMNSDVLPAYLDGLKKLESETMESSFDYIQTLESYLRFGNFKQAAQELFIHENSLRYRIKKIGEMIYEDFDDIATRQDYIIRVNLWKLTRSLRNERSE